MTTIRPPTHLSKLGKRKWKQIVCQLGELKPGDSDSLCLLCTSWELYHTALDHVRQHGTTLKSEVNGRLFINPNCNLISESWKQIVKLSKAFGLGPGAREAADRDEDDMLSLLNGGAD